MPTKTKTKTDLERELAEATSELWHLRRDSRSKSSSGRTELDASLETDGSLLVLVRRDGMTVHSFSYSKEIPV